MRCAQSRLQTAVAVSNLKSLTSFPIVVDTFVTTIEAALRRTGSEGQRTGINAVVRGRKNCDGSRNCCNCESELLAQGEAEETTKGAKNLAEISIKCGPARKQRQVLME